MANPAKSRAGEVSTDSVIKGPMIDETYAALGHWDFEISTRENLSRIKSANSIGASSARWLHNVCKVLGRRFEPAGRDRVLAELAQGGLSYETWKPLMLWHMTRDEFLVGDFLVNWLFPQFQAGALRLRAEDVYPYLQGLHEKGIVAKPWSGSTRNRVASGLLRIAMAFGLMKGMTVREFTPYHIPEAAFMYLLHAMAEVQPNARAIVHSPDWRMFLMNADAVERELFHLHQFRKLHYEVAGSLAQLTLPCATAHEYAQEMLA